MQRSVGSGAAVVVSVVLALVAGACSSGDDELAGAPVTTARAEPTTAPTEQPAPRRAVAAPASTAVPTTDAPPTPPPPARLAPTTSAPTTTPAPTTTLTLAPTTTVAPALPPTTAPPPPTAAPLTLPAPIAAPEDSESSEPRVELGGIEIPAIDLTRAMFEGIRLPTLDQGPGHWPGTAMPGELGNVVVAGHRVSHNEDFRNLDQLAPGDEVIFTTASGRHVYLVESTEIVGPDALWIVDQTPDHRATLFACHPPGSTRERIVVHLRLA